MEARAYAVEPLRSLSTQRHHLGLGPDDIGRPRIHEPASAFEQIGAEVGPLHAAHRTRLRGFGELTRLAGVGTWLTG